MVIKLQNTMKTLVWMMIAFFGFLSTYKVVILIRSLEMSTMADVTLFICWWLAAYVIFYYVPNKLLFGEQATEIKEYME